MLELPIPTYVALTLCYLGLRAGVRGMASVPTLAFICACALQSLIVALAQHQHLHAAIVVQPITASAVPPLAWLAYIAGAQRPLALRADAIHLSGPVCVLAGALWWPSLLDVLLPALYVGYGLMLMRSLADSAGALPQARLEFGVMPVLLWRGVALTLLASAASDVLIVLDHVLADGRWTPWIVSLVSSVSLLLLGLLGLSPALTTDAAHEPGEAHRTWAEESPAGASAVATDERAAQPLDDEDDQALMGRLDELMTTQRMFLEDDLTLARLARRLGVPAKRLSASINRVHGENVSRRVNRYRIEHACQALQGGASVTAALHDSGFATKSNFNREFLRLKGLAPSAWRAQALDAAGHCAT